MATRAERVAFSALLTDTTADLYTVASGQSAVVTILWANMDNSTAYTINIYLKLSGGSDVLLTGADETVNASARGFYPPSQHTLRLAAGDKIRGKASTASKIAVNIAVVESVAVSL
jgi:hypothetical protein